MISTAGKPTRQPNPCQFPLRGKFPPRGNGLCAICARILMDASAIPVSFCQRRREEASRTEKLFRFESCAASSCAIRDFRKLHAFLRLDDTTQGTMGDRMASDYRSRVGARIRLAREAKGWTQRRLARELDVAEAQVSRWENGRAMPSPQSLEACARALDVMAETFLRD